MGRVKTLKLSGAARVGTALRFFVTSRLKGVKFLSATGVAMALFSLVPLGITMVRPWVSHTFWNLQVWPRLAMLLAALPVVLAALITGCLVRRQRPECLAAVVGGVGGLFALVLPFALEHRGAGILAPLFASWSLALPLAVACWLGANYWRSDTWRVFWSGPSGAIVRGGVVAGLLVLPLRVVLAWYHHTVVHGHVAGHTAPLFPFHWSSHAVTGLSAIAWAAMITALLVSWRPSPWRGAFAGSGIAAALAGLSLAMNARSLGALPPDLREASGLLLRILLLSAGLSVVMSAIAGSFAGRWEVKSGVQPPPD